MRQAIVPPDSGLMTRIDSLSSGQAGWRSQSYLCQQVTPMYGGGVKPGEVDVHMPIRVSSLRGQLRFWWRIACAQTLDAQTMFRREVDIWGGIGEKSPAASKVRIRVSDWEAPRLEVAHGYRPDQGGNYSQNKRSCESAYALFSADANTMLAREGIAFKLHVEIREKLSAEQIEEVNTALRWWASFGGIGARTRRGLGSVLVNALPPVSAEEIQERGGELRCLPACKNAGDAWCKAIERFRNFRQGEGVGRNPRRVDARSPAGRSRWPEADTLRALSKRAAAEHRTRIVQANVFARAAFGLPIVFHFKDRGEPQDHILEPSDLPRGQNRDRMASPLILRPYWDGKAWSPAAVLLPGWQEALRVDLKFKGQHYLPERWPDDPAHRTQLASQIMPMQGRGSDPLSAFMTFFGEG